MEDSGRAVNYRCLVSSFEEPYALTVHVRVCEGPRGMIPEVYSERATSLKQRLSTKLKLHTDMGTDRGDAKSASPSSGAP